MLGQRKRSYKTLCLDNNSDFSDEMDDSDEDSNYNPSKDLPTLRQDDDDDDDDESHYAI